MLTSLDHVVVLVENLQTATDAYCRLLGRSPSWRTEDPQTGVASTSYRLDNTILGLISPLARGAFGESLRERLQDQGDGMLSLQFGTDDIDACVRTLRDRGIDAQEPIDSVEIDEPSGAQRAYRRAILPWAHTRGLTLLAVQHLSQPEPMGPAPAGRDPATSVAAVDHVVVMSPDIEASRRLYGDRLGLRLALDRSFEERGVRLLFFRVGGVTVEVGGSIRTAPDPTADDRFGGIAWRVDDVPGTRERLVEQGFEVSQHRAGFKPGTRVCTVEKGDTHGVPTLIIGPDDADTPA